MKSKRKSYRRKLPKHKTRRRRGKSKITKGKRKLVIGKLIKEKIDIIIIELIISINHVYNYCANTNQHFQTE